MITFALPDVGEGLHEAEIVAWHVAVGDHVVADQPLVSIETDKAVIEIPSPRAGHVVARYGEPGDVIDVGSALVDIADESAADAGAIVGDLPGPAPAVAAPAVARVPEGRAPPVAGAPPHSTAAVRATPAARTLASALGVDLGALTPSGPEGTVTRSDVEAAALAPAAGEGGPLEPLRGVRRALDANMSRSHAEVVPATVTEEADIDDWPAGTDTMLRLLRAIVAACAREPALNAAYLGRHRGRRLQDHVDVGIALDTDGGLFVPVLRDVADRDEVDLRRALDELRADVQARTVPHERLRGATITLSNFGSLGGRFAALVVVPPQVAIVGAGRARDAVVPRADRPAIRRLLPLSLTFDHRVVTGGEAIRFLTALIGDLEEPT